MPERQHDPLHRYHRQMLLEGIGSEGQRRLAESHAVLIGCGALGCGVADLLARAGVGTLTIIDRDVVEETNLQRQVLFDERHLAAGLPKAEAARQRLGEINSTVRVVAHVAEFNANTAASLVPGLSAGEAGGRPRSKEPLTQPSSGSSEREWGEGGRPAVLIDGTDNFETRLLINDLAVAREVPYVYAGVVAARGMVLTVRPWVRGPCLRCLVERVPAPGSVPTCDTAGVLGAAVGQAVALQAAEAMKVLMAHVDLLSSEMVEFDLWAGTQRRLKVDGLRDPQCACCAKREFDYLEGRAGAGSSVLCGRGSVQVSPATEGVVDLAVLAARLERSGTVTRNAFLVRARPQGEMGENREAVTITVFRDGRAIVSGTSTPERARGVYDRYVGG